MRKINLKAKNISSESVKEGYSGKISLVGGFVLLFLAGILYGGTWYLQNTQKKKVTVLKNNIQVLKNDLDKNKDYKQLYNFQDKLLELKRIFGNKIIQSDILNKISENTLNENSLKNLKIAINSGRSDITLTVQTSDLNNLAKQITAYSQIDINKQALLKGSSLGEDGVEASIQFSIGNINDKITPRDF